MQITWKKSDGFLTIDGGDRKIVCWSKVRNELNGLRPNRAKEAAGDPDLYHTFPDNLPSMPRPFPEGSCHITGLRPHPDPNEDHGYLYPYFIETDAYSMVDVWALDEKGFYKAVTGRKVRDSALGLHYSTCDWTNGCIRISLLQDLLYLVSIIRPELATGRQPDFVVSE